MTEREIDLSDAGLRTHAYEWCGKNQTTYSEWTIDELTNAFIALRDAARAEQQERDALAICLQCREALQQEGPEVEKRSGQWVHVHGEHDWRSCDAAAIRASHE